MELSLRSAEGIARAAITHASRSGILICVAVCDPNGRLITFSKMDGSSALTGHEAIRRAVTAAGSGEPSDAGLVRNSRAATVECEGTGASEQPGGLPIVKSGQCIGGIGVCGDATSQQEIECAMAARIP